jgi:hypothetical protein
MDFVRLKTDMNNTVIPLILLSLLVSGCGSASAPALQPEVIVEPLAVATSEPLPAATIVPPTSTAAALTQPKTLAELGIPFTTYIDRVAGLAFDYPSAWNLIDLSDEAKSGSYIYSISLRSGSPAVVGKEQAVDESITAIDIVVYNQAPGTLEQAVSDRRLEILQPESGLTGVIQLEEEWTLSGGQRAYRMLINLGSGPGARDKLVSELATIINGKLVLVVSSGDLSLYNIIASSLRESK